MLYYCEICHGFLSCIFYRSHDELYIYSIRMRLRAYRKSDVMMALTDERRTRCSFREIIRAAISDQLLGNSTSHSLLLPSRRSIGRSRDIFWSHQRTNIAENCEYSSIALISVLRASVSYYAKRLRPNTMFSI